MMPADPTLMAFAGHLLEQSAKYGERYAAVLFLPSATVRGTLISAAEWWALANKPAVWEVATEAERLKLHEGLFGMADRVDFPDYPCLHLKDVRFVGVSPLPPALPSLRVRAADVVAFNFERSG